MKESRKVHAVGTLTAESGKPAGKRKNGLPFYTHLPGNLFLFEEISRSFHWENPPVEGKGIQEEDTNFLGLQSLMIFLLPLMVLKESAKGFVVEILISTFCSVQFSCSVMSNSLRPHESQHARPPCPSPTPGVHSNSCPSSQ